MLMELLGLITLILFLTSKKPLDIEKGTSKNSKRTNNILVPSESLDVEEKSFICIGLGETAGEKGTFCQGKREFLPG